MSNKSRLLLCTTLLLISAIGSQAQPQTSSNPVKNAPNVERRIVYTGKLLGYFRVPSKQSGQINHCPQLGEKQGGASDEASAFLTRRAADPNSILVGTGDNFSPQFEARTFDPVPKTQGAGKYSHGNKELFNWDGSKWIDYTDDSIRKRLAAGLGTIPNDNVGCFLAAAKYAAIVPGKHDFYFGADRVRQLARFLAGIQPSDDYKPVQMLGANLVMSTSEIKPQSLLPREVEQPWWVKAKIEWPKDYPVLNLKDEETIYPWFSYVKVKLLDHGLKVKEAAQLKDWLYKKGGVATENDLREYLTKQGGEFGKLENNLAQKSTGFQSIKLYRCPSDGEPNKVPKPPGGGCVELVKKEIGLFNDTLAYFVTIPREGTGKNGHFSTATPGNNYGLCSVSAAGASCLRFGVFRPFFYHPHEFPKTTTNHIDPDPYVLTEDGVAIFGVVDPELSTHVGVLNFGWQHKDTQLKTVVNVQDPAKALRQQLDYFERRCREEKCNFTGLKVLLAQMSPQRARVLGARLPEFQVIVTAADAEQGTSLTGLASNWTPNSRAGSLVAVPLPTFNRSAKATVVHYSEVQASLNNNEWWLSSDYDVDPKTFPISEALIPKFWDRVDTALSTCIPSNLKDELEAKTDGVEKLEWLTLCALREKMGTDVSLVQSRDFFDTVPEGTADTKESTQELLDRLIWKGDLVTLLFVRGKALKQALKDSDRFAAEDRSTLSLADEKARQLKMLGIDTDKGTDEHLIKELPIDEAKSYTVSTTDYIGAGDTGYPALAESALNPRTHPAAFPRTLISLSGAVCRKLFTDSAEAELYCRSEIVREDYIDETIAPLVPTQKVPSFFKRAWDNFLFRLPPKDTIASEPGPGLQEMAQRRPFWNLSVRKISLGYAQLSNTLTDAEIDKSFPGVSNTAVQAHKNKSFSVGINSRVSHFTHKRELFLEGGIDFKRTSTGVSNDVPIITQTVNRIFLDPGVTFRFPGKSLPHWGLVLSVHLETPFQSPVSTFTLATKRVVDEVNNIEVNNRLDLTQSRSIQVLPRFGLRLQNKDNFFEGGVQAGYELRAFSGYLFNTPGVVDPVECRLDPTKSLADCITEKSDPAKGLITTESAHSAILDNRKRAGFYWKMGFSMPFTERIKYELEDEGNFFANFRGDTPVDTKLLDISKHRLRLFIVPSVSVGPTYQLLFYKNKADNWLTQRTFTFETVITFDLFNRRERQVQLKNKP